MQPFVQNGDRVALCVTNGRSSASALNFLASTDSQAGLVITSSPNDFDAAISFTINTGRTWSNLSFLGTSSNLLVRGRGTSSDGVFFAQMGGTEDKPELVQTSSALLYNVPYCLITTSGGGAGSQAKYATFTNGLNNNAVFMSSSSYISIVIVPSSGFTVRAGKCLPVEVRGYLQNPTCGDCVAPPKPGPGGGGLSGSTWWLIGSYISLGIALIALLTVLWKKYYEQTDVSKWLWVLFGVMLGCFVVMFLIGEGGRTQHIAAILIAILSGVMSFVSGWTLLDEDTHRWVYLPTAGILWMITFVLFLADGESALNSLKFAGFTAIPFAVALMIRAVDRQTGDKIKDGLSDTGSFLSTHNWTGFLKLITSSDVEATGNTDQQNFMAEEAHRFKSDRNGFNKNEALLNEFCGKKLMDTDKDTAAENFAGAAAQIIRQHLWSTKLKAKIEHQKNAYKESDFGEFEKLKKNASEDWNEVQTAFSFFEAEIKKTTANKKQEPQTFKLKSLPKHLEIENLVQDQILPFRNKVRKENSNTDVKKNDDYDSSGATESSGMAAKIASAVTFKTNLLDKIDTTRFENQAASAESLTAEDAQEAVQNTAKALHTALNRCATELKKLNDELTELNKQSDATKEKTTNKKNQEASLETLLQVYTKCANFYIRVHDVCAEKLTITEHFKGDKKDTIINALVSTCVGGNDGNTDGKAGANTTTVDLEAGMCIALVPELKALKFEGYQIKDFKDAMFDKQSMKLEAMLFKLHKQKCGLKNHYFFKCPLHVPYQEFITKKDGLIWDFLKAKQSTYFEETDEASNDPMFQQDQEYSSITRCQFYKFFSTAHPLYRTFMFNKQFLAEERAIFLRKEQQKDKISWSALFPEDEFNTNEFLKLKKESNTESNTESGQKTATLPPYDSLSTMIDKIKEQIANLKKQKEKPAAATAEPVATSAEPAAAS